jgi:hypothetical protein
MGSSTKNVKLGVCKILFAGVDLGYTKGGVDVEVKTETHKTQVDQFGKTTINEYLMGREVLAKAPLAETTIENMIAIMPGASMSSTGGTVASGTITITTNPVAGDTILVNGVTVAFKAALTGAADEVLIGLTAAATAANLADALNKSTTEAIAAATYSAAAAVVTVKYGNALVYGANGNKSVDGNAFTLVTGIAAAKVTMSGATLTGGADATAKSVSVNTGIGIDLLSLAKELRLHPIGKPESDKSEDFVIPLAATAGALKFAYKLEDERVYDVEFGGYPDANGKLFTVGV